MESLNVNIKIYVKVYLIQMIMLDKQSIQLHFHVFCVQLEVVKKL